jgi:hypothetical protein
MLLLLLLLLLLTMLTRLTLFCGAGGGGRIDVCRLVQ